METGPALAQEAAQLPPIPTEFPELGDLQLPSIEKAVLSNGLRVFLVEDHDVPLVKTTLLFRGGLRTSRPDKVGLATIASGVQRAGGSVQHPSAALDDALEQKAAYIEGGATPETSSLGFECLKDDVREVMGLFLEILQTPALPQSKIDLYKSQVLNVVDHLWDNPAAIPKRQLGKLLYGADSVFARTPRPEQVQGLTRGDIIAHLARWQRPDNAVLGVAGDFDPCEMKALLEEKLGSWHRQPTEPDQVPRVPNTPIPAFAPGADTVYLVDRPGLTQASVGMGELGISLGDPDDWALDVLGDILNSFGGRLFDRIRSREGLAYSVSGGWDTPLDHPGLFAAGGNTAAPAQFLEQLQRVLQEATEVAPTEREVALAKSEMLNSFVFNFASTNTQMQRVAAYALLGIPEDYLFTYKKGIEGVTAQDVLAAAGRHLHPAQQIVVMAADANLVRPQLERRGRTVVSLSLD
ncbi:g3232 [Coccomyxa viridis]|uniref:G3232 protein n=1 Tax=Coccomyxa viridis TaxID=1274662 RepID=A0ABP1FRB0_9CHLO